MLAQGNTQHFDSGTGEANSNRLLLLAPHGAVIMMTQKSHFSKRIRCQDSSPGRVILPQNGFSAGIWKSQFADPLKRVVVIPYRLFVLPGHLTR